jgi:hypothetical protein
MKDEEEFEEHITKRKMKTDGIEFPIYQFFSYIKLNRADKVLEVLREKPEFAIIKDNVY